MEYHVTVDGVEIQLRGLTEEEAILIQDKRRRSLEDKNCSIEDDGEVEIKRLILSPPLEELKPLFRRHPRLGEQLFAKMVLLQDTQKVEEDLSVREDLELQEKYKGNVVGILWPVTVEQEVEQEIENLDGTVEKKKVTTLVKTKERFLFRRFSRFETKVLDREVSENEGNLTSMMLMKRVKTHSLEREKTDAFASSRPFFYLNVAWFLHSITYADLDFDVKKA